MSFWVSRLFASSPMWCLSTSLPARSAHNGVPPRRTPPYLFPMDAFCSSRYPKTRPSLARWWPGIPPTTTLRRSPAAGRPLEAVEQSGFGSAATPCADREGNYFFLEGAFLSPEASSLLITDPGGNVKVFDARTLVEETVPALPAGHRTVLAHGGTWLLSSDGQVAKVVDLSDGRVVATLATGSSKSWADVSATGELAAIFEWNPGELTVYDTGTWQPITSFAPGHSRGMSFSPDGSKILTAQQDGYVRNLGHPRRE